MLQYIYCYCIHQYMELRAEVLKNLRRFKTSSVGSGLAREHCPA